MFRLTDRATGEIVFEGKPVSRSNPCPVCSHLHRNQSWCLVDTQRGKTICPRVESKRRIGDAGWLHGDDGSAASAWLARLRTKEEEAAPDFRAAWDSARLAIRQTDSERLAKIVRLPVEMVAGVPHGWRSAAQAWVFPMRVPADAPVSEWPVCGLKTRRPDGGKFCVKGSRIGLIVCEAFDPTADTLVVTEGESDLMVAAHWRLNAVARAGCEQSVRDLSRLAVGKRVLIISDKDEAGRRGAARLRESMLGARRVTVIEPPCKDLREWFLLGATRDDLIWKLKAGRRSSC